ncbi:MAG: 50S ribosomal protein L35 [Candidatus Dependentiae bacterium]|jgi:large subunit ribosomal protein L35|nr:50S ribosomal protein L35 [Candidatus Dependentiae bacterium]
MPKMKTHSATKKRFKKLKNKIKFSHANKRHLLTKKSAKRRRGLRKSSTLCKSDVGRIARLLPNS